MLAFYHKPLAFLSIIYNDINIPKGKDSDMKTSLIVSVLCLSFITPALANDYWNEYNPQTKRDNYAGIRIHKNENIAFKYDLVGTGKTTVRRDNFSIGGYIGNRLSDHVKIEFETSYTGGAQNDFDAKYDFDVWANMFNIYLFQEFSGAIEPYAGFGIGFATIWGSIDTNTYHISDTTFDLSYQAMLGVNFALNDRIDLNVGIKYQYYGELEHKLHGTRFAETKVDATEIYFGAAYKFSL